MLDALSCLYFDWGTAGTWVGGLGSAGAAIVAVHVARQSSAAQQRQQQAFLVSLTVQMIPEITAAGVRLREMQMIHGAHLDHALSREMLRMALAIPSSKRLLELNANISASLALAAAEFVTAVGLVTNAIDMLEKGASPQRAMDLAQKHAALAFGKTIELAKALKREYPEAAAALQSVLNLEAEGS